MSSATTKMIMWLLAFCGMFVLALQPALSSQKLDLDAGWTSTDGTFYQNAPMYVANGVVDYDTSTITSANPLFTTSGVNVETLMSLMNLVNDESVWGSKTVSGSGTTYLTAKDFGQIDSGTGNGQIVVKLLDTTTTTKNAVNTASQQYWQVVYRSITPTEDVLTLYMVDQYTTDYFDNTSPKYSDYSNSDIRTTVLNTYETMKSTYSALDTYVVAPEDLPGLWQSSAYQTGALNSSTANAFGSGSSAESSWGRYYAIENGLDGESQPNSMWTSSSWSGIQSAYTDKLWVPSNYEVIYKDHTTDGKTSCVSDYASASATLADGTSGGTDGINDGRSGLWELNGYDRATGSYVWLRSGVSTSDFSGITLDNGGNSLMDRGDLSRNGVCVALHLDLKSLASTMLASISAEASGEGSVAPSVSSPAGNWAPAMQSYYSNLVIKNSTSNSGVATIEYGFNTSQYHIATLTFKNSSGTTLGTISNVGAVTDVALANACTYSITTTFGASGNVIITLKLIQQNLNVVATFEAGGSGYVVTYNYSTNGGTSATKTDATLEEGDSVDLSPTATKSGWNFVGWNTSSTATTELTSLTMGTQSITLYAIFSKTITANFYQLDGTNSSKSVTIYNTATNGSITSPSITTSSGQTAIGWNTSTSATTSSLPENTSKTISGGEKYYAVVSYIVTIVYNSNGGSGTMTDSTETAIKTANGTSSSVTQSATITLKNNTFTRNKYAFTKWAVGSASGTQYSAGASYTTSATSTTVYAIWDQILVDLTISSTITNYNYGIIVYVLEEQSNGKFTPMQQIVLTNGGKVTISVTKNKNYQLLINNPIMSRLSVTNLAQVEGFNSIFAFNLSSNATTAITVNCCGGMHNSIVV